MFVCVHVYIYIYIYTHIKYIYIYRYIYYVDVPLTVSICWETPPTVHGSMPLTPAVISEASISGVQPSAPTHCPPKGDPKRGI